MVGDSFTEAVYISCSKTYYGQLQRIFENSMEIFAFGCGGYGNLQEYMIIDKYLDMIKPDLILIQLCSNDFSNNDFLQFYANLREDSINKLGRQHECFNRAAKITKDILKRIKDRVGDIPVILFSVDDKQPYFDEFKKISEELGLQFIDTVPSAIRNYETKGHITRGKDLAHWNELGHEIAAQELAIYLKLFVDSNLNE